jgi:CubicO group peptidase (beta-lactamase class C family)
MDSQIAELCQDSIRNGMFPGCVVAYLRDGQAVSLPFGTMTYDVFSRAITDDTVYDIGSVTKSVPTSCLVLHLVERGLVSLDDKVITFIPEITDRRRGDLLVRHLLTYTVAFDIPGGLSRVARDSPQHILESIFTAPLAESPGNRYLATNPPAVLMGLLVERIANKPLNEYANEVFGSLHMDRTSFSSGWVGKQAVAPTEIDGRGEVQGVPLSASAWALRQAGKVAGHAGLFTTAPDLLIFAQMLLGEGTYKNRQYFAPETVKAMHTNQTVQSGLAYGLGWKIDRPDIMGAHGSNQKFGMVGLTGCMIVMDPVQKRAVVQVSNSTYPHRKTNDEQLNALRRQLCDLVLA